MISIYTGLFMIMNLDLHPQLSRKHHSGPAAAAQNNADNNKDGEDYSNSNDTFSISPMENNFKWK